MFINSNIKSYVRDNSWKKTINSVWMPKILTSIIIIKTIIVFKTNLDAWLNNYILKHAKKVEALFKILYCSFIQKFSKLRAVSELWKNTAVKSPICIMINKEGYAELPSCLTCENKWTGRQSLDFYTQSSLLWCWGKLSKYYVKAEVKSGVFSGLTECSQEGTYSVTLNSQKVIFWTVLKITHTKNKQYDLCPTCM